MEMTEPGVMYIEIGGSLTIKDYQTATKVRMDLVVTQPSQIYVLIVQVMGDMQVMEWSLAAAKDALLSDPKPYGVLMINQNPLLKAMTSLLSTMTPVKLDTAPTMEDALPRARLLLAEARSKA